MSNPHRVPNLRLMGLREKHHWSQAQVAELLGVLARKRRLKLYPTWINVQRWEKGYVRWPSREYRSLLCELFGVEIDALGFCSPSQRLAAQGPEHRGDQITAQPTPASASTADRPAAPAGGPPGPHGPLVPPVTASGPSGGSCRHQRGARLHRHDPR